MRTTVHYGDATCLACRSSTGLHGQQAVKLVRVPVAPRRDMARCHPSRKRFYGMDSQPPSIGYTLTPFHAFVDSITLMHLHLFLGAHEDEIRCCFSLCFRRHRMERGERKCQTVMRLSVCRCVWLCVNAVTRAAQNAQYLHARNARCSRGRMQAPGACGQTTRSSRSPRQTFEAKHFAPCVRAWLFLLLILCMHVCVCVSKYVCIC